MKPTVTFEYELDACSRYRDNYKEQPETKCPTG
jgi:hypothetical protein